MSYVNEFIHTFAGEAALSLLRCMAVANGNNPLDSITLTQSEATRYIVTYQENPLIGNYNDWKGLRDEIYGSIHDYRTDAIGLRRYVYRLMMDVRAPAAYYHCPEETDQNALAVNAFFACIMNCLQKAHTMLEAVGYLKIPLGDYNHKWDKPCFHDIRTIGIALERLGNIIQGCLYENDIRTPVFDYQSQCGVKLVETITIDSLVEAMDWTQTMAMHYMDSGDSKKRIVPLCTIEELAKAMADGQIDDKGHLLVSNRAFVMYCYEHRFFLPLNKKDWRKIDGLLTSDQGKTLSAGDLAKVAQQPPLRMLFIPANSSATAVYQVLGENDGQSIMFETEGDTLANTFASDYGNYSDGFRKAFHHETISYVRRKDREYVNLKHPRLSALLTGTPKQVSSLITDAENGLFSRFIFYYLSTKVTWQNVFEQTGDRTLDDHFRTLGEEFHDFHTILSEYGTIRFYLTSDQQTRFNTFFERAQTEYVQDLGEDIIASVRRQLFLDKLPDSFTRKDFIDISASLGIPLKTAERHISQWCKDGVIDRIEQGRYLKR